MLDIATSQHIDIDVAALSAPASLPGADGLHPRRRHRRAETMIDNHHINEQQALVNYPPLLLKEGRHAERRHAARCRQYSAAGWRCRCWKATSTATGWPARRRTAACGHRALQQQQQEDPALVIADARYQSIAALCDAVSNSQQAMPNRLTEMLDKVILNRWLGVPIFPAGDVPDVPAGDQHRRRAAADL